MLITAFVRTPFLSNFLAYLSLFIYYSQNVFTYQIVVLQEKDTLFKMIWLNTEGKILVIQFKKKKEVNHSVNTTVKNLPAMQETQVQSLAQEDPLENSMDSRD